MTSVIRSMIIMTRFFDFLIAVFFLVATLPLCALIFVLGLMDTGSPIFKQVRLGKSEKHFLLLKFRTMKLNSPSVASHLASSSDVTNLGKFLRKTKLDELPQLINVLKGEMSLVGPRPNLPNQRELIVERRRVGVYDVLPGITGLAQISGVDMSTPSVLAKKDLEGIKNRSLRMYFLILRKTFFGKGLGDAIS